MIIKVKIAYIIITLLLLAQDLHDNITSRSRNSQIVSWKRPKTHCRICFDDDERGA